MKKNATHPQVRVNKNGVAQVRHVLSDTSTPPSGASKQLPGPALATESAEVPKARPALRGKALKEAMEIVRLAQNGTGDYEDRIVAHFLENDLDSMRALHSICMDDDANFNNVASNYILPIADNLQRLGVVDTDLETRIAKLKMHVELTDSGFEMVEDHTEGGDWSDKLVRFYDENWYQIEDVKKFQRDREFDVIDPAELIAAWKEFTKIGNKPLRDGAL